MKNCLVVLFCLSLVTVAYSADNFQTAHKYALEVATLNQKAFKFDKDAQKCIDSLASGGFLLELFSGMEKKQKDCICKIPVASTNNKIREYVNYYKTLNLGAVLKSNISLLERELNELKNQREGEFVQMCNDSYSSPDTLVSFFKTHLQGIYHNIGVNNHYLLVHFKGQL